MTEISLIVTLKNQFTTHTNHSSPNTGTYMYFLNIKTLYLYPFSRVVNAIPSVHLTDPVFFILFVFCYNHFQYFLPRIFIFGLSYPTLPIYPLKMIWNPSNMRLSIFERIRRVPLQRGGQYLKEPQPECKPETCTGKWDLFSFIW